MAIATGAEASARRARNGARFHVSRLPPLSARYIAIAAGTLLLVIGHFAAIFTPSSSVSALAVIAPCATAAGLVAFIAAAMRVALPHSWRAGYAAIRPFASGLIVVLALAGTLGFLICVGATLYLPPATLYTRDVISFTYVDANLIAHGRNPYTSDDAFVDALRQFPGAPPTPLLRGVYDDGTVYPVPDTLKSLTLRFLDAPASVRGVFDPRTLHSYPALAYLVYAPAVVLGLPNILFVHLLAAALLAAWLVRLAPAHLRVWTLLAAVGAVTIPLASLLFDTEIVCVALLLPAWHYRDRRWLGPLLLGLACAFKQYAWLFVPFFVLDALLAHGWREALRRTLVTSSAFLLPNVPFLLASPGAWFTSLWLPVTDHMYPLGMGVIAFAVGHVLPRTSATLYALLELVALGACLGAAVRWRYVLGEASLLLPLVPLYFAFRSPADYFALAPWIALYLAARRIHAYGGVPEPAALIPSAPAASKPA